jgi:hypothetical protein
MAFQPPAQQGAPRFPRHKASLGSIIARVALTDIHTDALRSLESNWNSDASISRPGSASDIRALLGCCRPALDEALISSHTARNVLTTFSRQVRPPVPTEKAPTKPQLPSRHSLGLAVHAPATVVHPRRCSSGRRRPVTVCMYDYSTGPDGVTTEVRTKRRVRLRTAANIAVSEPHHVCPACAAPIACVRPVSHFQRVL